MNPLLGRDVYGFLRFAAVGATAVELNILLYAAFVELLGIPYLWATVLIFAIGNAYGFALNRSWVFRQRDRPLQRLVRYYATMGLGLGANILSMVVLVDVARLHYIVASILTSLWLAPILYVTHRQIAFRPSGTNRNSVMVTTNYFAEHGGGVEIVAGELARRLASRWPMQWYAAGSTTTSEGRDVLQRIAVPAWNGLERHYGLPVPIPTLRGLRLLLGGVKRSRGVWIHDLLYVSNLVASLTAIARGKPLLVTIHVGTIPYRSSVARWLVTGGLALFAPFILKRAFAVAFVSERVRQEYAVRYSCRNALLIPNGVDPEIFRPMDAERRASARKQLGLGQEPVVLFVGRFVERKGLGLMRVLARETPDVRWVFAGSGPLDPSQWGFDNVLALGSCARGFVASLYGLADLVVLPSVGEGFPLVVQEALACGARVLVDPTTAAGFVGSDAHLQCEPVTGGRVVERWRTRIGAILASEDPEPSRQSRAAFARARWNWDEAANRYGVIIESLFSAPASHGTETPSTSW